MKPTGLNIKNNEAYLYQYRLADLAKEYQTPLYIMDQGQIEASIHDYQTYFKSDLFSTTIVYASKAFLTASFANVIGEHQLHMDAVSIGDLYVIHRSGFDMQHVVFHGNNKSIDELAYAIDHEVGWIVVDNYLELVHLDALTRKKEKAVQLLIRVNPGINAHTHQYIQTAKFTSKFGESIYDTQMIEKMVTLCVNAPYLHLKGFHAHIGSQIHEKEAFNVEIHKMIEFQNRVNEKFNLTLDTLNLGGGFGIQYTYDEKKLSIQETMESLVTNIEKEIKKTNSLIHHFMIEPGRSIVGEAGITIYECSQIKKTYGKKNYLFVNGGMTDNIRPALYQAVYECDVVQKMNQPKDMLVDVVGKCCESGDIIRKDVMVPSIDEGDLLMVYATGAYNYSMSSNYNNQLKPAVIFVKDKVTVLSRRERLEDLYRLF